jgi:hypothetical protein
LNVHTGHYADTTGAEQQAEFERIKNMATYAHSIGLQVNAGHGLTLGANSSTPRRHGSGQIMRTLLTLRTNSSTSARVCP